MTRKSGTLRTAIDCKAEFERMLKNSQTKVIMPAIGLGVLREFLVTQQSVFTDSELRGAYEAAVHSLKKHLGHDVHVGAKYEDAYGMRMSRYGMLRSIGHLRYELAKPFREHATELTTWLPDRIKQHIDARVGIIPDLADAKTRLKLARNRAGFVKLINEQIDRNPTTFEIVSFAVIKVHLERFACKIYRDTRRIHTRAEADKLYAELRLNFDAERLQDGNVILVIDDIAEDVRRYLIDMKVQSIKREHLIALASGFEDEEDRQKVLRVIYEEFRRDYSSVI